MSDDKELDTTITDIDFVEPGIDCGPIFDGRCPNCNEAIRVAEMQWWKSICDCGLTWRLNITIKGDYNG